MSVCALSEAGCWCVHPFSFAQLLHLFSVFFFIMSCTLDHSPIACAVAQGVLEKSRRETGKFSLKTTPIVDDRVATASRFSEHVNYVFTTEKENSCAERGEVRISDVSLCFRLSCRVFGLVLSMVCRSCSCSHSRFRFSLRARSCHLLLLVFLWHCCSSCL